MSRKPKPYLQPALDAALEEYQKKLAAQVLTAYRVVTGSGPMKYASGGTVPAPWVFGTVLTSGRGIERGNRVLFICFLSARLADGNKGFLGMTIVANRDAQRSGRLNRIDRFPVAGWEIASEP